MKFLFTGVCLIASLLFVLPAFSDESTVSVNIPTPSSRAQNIYEAARNDLLQIRVLLKNGKTQSSVGSGFLIGTSNLVVTNYHVVSQIVMDPQLYVGEFVDTNGKRGSVTLVAVDALHDLAVVKVNRTGTGYFQVPETLPTLQQGQYLYSLGNPLDLGFAISEGAYNGVIRRGFTQQLMFTGPINSGMSGGPNITEQNVLAGVNVAKRLDGELVSFLVPVAYVRDLLNHAKAKPTQSFKASVGQQLLAHQQLMTDTVLSEPFQHKTLGKYQVPTRESDQIRCWGQSNKEKEAPYRFNSVNCAMESAIFVSDQLQVGHMAIRHEYVNATELSSVRFYALQSQSFKNEQFGNDKDRNRTAPQCQERFVQNSQLPLRAVLCVRAYREFEGLYDFSLLTASTDDNHVNLQSRIDANGVSYENGLKISRQFIEAIHLTKTTTTKAPLPKSVKP